MRIKYKVTVEREADVATVAVAVPVDDEDMPQGFPGRVKNTWHAIIDADTGKIQGWPRGRAETVHVKARDGGTYQVYDRDSKLVAAVERDYVPDWIPGECGDYVIFEIDGDGVIGGWMSHFRKLAASMQEDGR